MILAAFAEVLENFDHIILVDIYAAREQNTVNISSQDLVNKIIENGKSAIYIKDFNEVAQFIKNNAKPQDIVLTLGAGTVTDIGPMLVK